MPKEIHETIKENINNKAKLNSQYFQQMPSFERNLAQHNIIIIAKTTKNREK